MKKYIVVLVHPFIMGQYICVYDGEECKERIVADFDSAPEEIIKTALKNDIKEVHLKGNSVFTSKIKDNTLKCTQFDKEKIEIFID